ncbi:MAG: hypothetical protein JW832_11005 [Deltaproteobacteria bacterium]|nr:hypothetical protein [Deltaproteobacteria bacterium]
MAAAHTQKNGRHIRLNAFQAALSTQENRKKYPTAGSGRMKAFRHAGLDRHPVYLFFEIRLSPEKRTLQKAAG